MQFNHSSYVGTGINHDHEPFQGRFVVTSLQNTNTYQYSYIATRTSDGEKVHEEVGLIGNSETGEQILTVHMEELPCHTTHSLTRNENSEFCFSYEGSGSLAGFSSELVFQFGESGFKYLHRWAMGGVPSDKSWCQLEPE